MTYTIDALRWRFDEFEEKEPYSYTYRSGQTVTGFHEYCGFEGILDRYLNGKDKTYEVDGIGTMKIVEDERSGEGGGDYAAIVFEMIAEDGSTRLFKKEGFYASYSGYTWDGDLYEVRPATKTVTVYERV